MLSHNGNKAVIPNVGDLPVLDARQADVDALQKLILSAKAGNKEDFETLYHALITPLYRYVISRCRDAELANDICQQTFLNFYKALPTYEPEKSPLAYLFTIAKRLLINVAEKKKTVPYDESFFETEDGGTDIMSEVHIKLLAESINEYLPHLTDDEQDVIRLYYYGEFTHKEIADIIDREEAYIRKIKERALKKLRALTTHLHEEH